MVPGKQENVTMRFIAPLLDTVVDRFGTSGVVYSKDADGKHVKAIVNVALSEEFFGLVCGFGKRMKIVSPSPVVEDFKQYLDKIRGMYD